jgi:phage recombination protein Bet
MSDGAVAIPQPEYSREQVELLKRTVCKGATDDELRLFINTCRRTGLDPFARQIYAIKRWDTREKREIIQAQTSIDGFRLIADRSGKYQGQLGPFWCGFDGVWRDVWIDDEDQPVAARVGVLKTGCTEPFWSVAKYSEYVQVDRDGNAIAMWRKMPANQLAKCAESLSLRKAFPQEMSGLYTGDELPAPEPAAEKPWRTFREMLAVFAEAKAQLGPDRENVYYGHLQMAGVKHANEFKDSAKALACYGRLQEAIENFPQAVEDNPTTS